MVEEGSGTRTELGSVAALQVTPVKGFRIQQVPEVRVTEVGVAGDREHFLVDEGDRLFSATRSGVFLPYTAHWDPGGRRLAFRRDGQDVCAGPVEEGEPVVVHFFEDHYRRGRVVPGPFGAWVSGLAGRPLRLVRAEEPGGGLDEEPLTLVSGASLGAVEVPEDGACADQRRFRLTITVDAGDEAFVEDSWEGSTMRVGEAVLRILGAVPRCAAVQRQPDTGEGGTNVLKQIFERRGRGATGALELGVYAQVLDEGVVRVGDRLLAEPGRG